MQKAYDNVVLAKKHGDASRYLTASDRNLPSSYKQLAKKRRIFFDEGVADPEKLWRHTLTPREKSRLRERGQVCSKLFFADLSQHPRGLTRCSVSTLTSRCSRLPCIVPNIV